MLVRNLFLLVASIALTLVSTPCQAKGSQDVSPDLGLNTSSYSTAGQGLCFTENKGQWDSRVLFKADGAGGLTWFIERDGFTVLFSVPDSNDSQQDSQQNKQRKQMGGNPLDDPSVFSVFSVVNEPRAMISHALKFRFQSTLPRTAGNFLPEQTTPASALSIESSERLSWNNNYFLGSDESKWAPNCGNYERVTLKNVWNGIDIVWRGVGKSVEFDFAIQPGADVKQIRVACLGLTGDLETTADGGELLLPTSLGVLRQSLPEAYQIEPSGSYTEVRAQFAVTGNSFGVKIPEGHNPTKPLVIDPLIYSTYLGGDDKDFAQSITSDEEGCVVITGCTWSNDFPTNEGVFDQSYNRGQDIFITRVNQAGSQILYSTYLGGSDDDCSYAITPDLAGGVVVVGSTYSNDFPTTEFAIDNTHNGVIDVFVARLNGDGSELLYGTYWGGRVTDIARAVVADGAEGVFVAGYTYSADFPTTVGAFDRIYNDGFADIAADAFVVQLRWDPKIPSYSTFLGGARNDACLALTPDGTGGVIVAGYGDSRDFPTTEGAFDRSFNGTIDCFITRLSRDGSHLIFSTYLGGSNDDYLLALTSAEDGGAIVAGYTRSADFPTTEGAFDRALNGGPSDAFVTRLTGDGSALVFSTYLGGVNFDIANTLISDGAGGVIVAGGSDSEDFPTTDDAFDNSWSGGCDVFLTRLNAGGQVLYSTYLGGSGDEEAWALTQDQAGGVVVAGYTTSEDFPTTEEAFDREYNGGTRDAFVARFSDLIEFSPLTCSLTNPNGGEVFTIGDSIKITWKPKGGSEIVRSIIKYSTNNGDVWTNVGETEGQNFSFVWRLPYVAGDYLVKVKMTDSDDSTATDQSDAVFSVGPITLKQRGGAGWSLMSVPLIQMDMHKKSVLGDDLDGLWALIGFDGGIRQLFPDTLENAKGYLLGVIQGAELDITGVPNTNPTHTFTLKKGWNTFGSPFHLPTPLADATVKYTNDAGEQTCTFAEAVDARILSPVAYNFFDDRLPDNHNWPLINGFQPYDTLQNWRGYWYLCFEDGVQLILTNPEAPAAPERDDEAVVSAEDWHLDFLCASDSSGDDVRMGVNEQANPGFDNRFDYVEPPSPEVDNRIRMYFDHTSWDIPNATQFSRDIRAPLSTGDMQEWTLIIESPSATDLTIFWDAIADTALDKYTFTLIDADNGTDLNLRDEKEYKFHSEGTKQLIVKVGTYEESTNPRYATITGFGLTSLYPNPFNSVTTISYGVERTGQTRMDVMDINGRVLTTLVEGVKLAGTYRVTWDAKSIPTGVYLVRMTDSSGRTAARKVILLK